MKGKKTMAILCSFVMGIILIFIGFVSIKIDSKLYPVESKVKVNEKRPEREKSSS